MAWTLICVLLAVADAQVCDQQCKQSQRTALARLYDALDGQRWQRSAGWMSAEDHCSWLGVACCASANTTVPQGAQQFPGCSPVGAVVSLDLSLNGLAGALPSAAFSGLEVGLEQINLLGNQISGGLPESIGGLLRLQQLRINDNKLTGVLPVVLGTLPRLALLDFSRNNISGGNRAARVLQRTVHVGQFDTTKGWVICLHMKQAPSDVSVCVRVRGCCIFLAMQQAAVEVLSGSAGTTHCTFVWHSITLHVKCTHHRLARQSRSEALCNPVCIHH